MYPNDATVDYMSHYTLACDEGYTVSHADGNMEPNMVCQSDGYLDHIDTCIGNTCQIGDFFY